MFPVVRRLTAELTHKLTNKLAARIPKNPARTIANNASQQSARSATKLPVTKQAIAQPAANRASGPTVSKMPTNPSKPITLSRFRYNHSPFGRSQHLLSAPPRHLMLANKTPYAPAPPLRPSWATRTQNVFRLPNFFVRPKKSWFMHSFLPKVFKFMFAPFAAILAAVGITKSKVHAAEKEEGAQPRIKTIPIFSSADLEAAKEGIKAFDVPVRPVYPGPDASWEAKQEFWRLSEQYENAAKDLRILCENEEYSINFSYSYRHHKKEYDALESGLEAHAEEKHINGIEQNDPAYLITMKSKDALSTVAIGLFDKNEKPTVCTLMIGSIEKNIDRFQQFITQTVDDLNKKQVKTLYLKLDKSTESSEQMARLQDLGFTVTAHNDEVLAMANLDTRQISLSEQNKKIDPQYAIDISPTMTLSKAEQLLDTAVESLEDTAKQTASKTPSVPYETFGIFIKNKQGDNLGGICCGVEGEELHIDMLWLSKEVRGQHLSKTLVDLAETHARKRGCAEAFLETEERHAPWLYPKLGYTNEFPLPMGPGMLAYYFKKRLEPSSAISDVEQAPVQVAANSASPKAA